MGRIGKVVAALLMLSLSAYADQASGSDSVQERLERMERDMSAMRQQIREQADLLQKQEEQIKSAQQPALPPRTEDVDATVRAVLADAEKHTQFLANGAKPTAGYNNGFFIASGDDFMMRIKGLLMIRYTYSHQDDSGGDDDRGGFELARTRFGFFGHVIDPSWQFVLWTGYNTEGNTALLDVFIKKTFEGGWSITAGQYKMPFWREWLISETRLPMAERSLLNKFSGSYVQGVMGAYEQGNIHAYLSLSDGANSINTNAMVEDVEGVAVTARAEWLVMGKWSQYPDAEAWPGEEPLLVFAAAGHYQKGETGTLTEEAELLRWNIDGTLKIDRFSTMLVLLGNHQDNGAKLDQFGVLAQAGYFVTENMEAHIRYEWGDSDIEGDEDLSILTVGLDQHWAKHQVRLIVDVGYSFNAVSAFWANPFAGYRTDAAGKGGQIVVRSQLELNF